MANTKTKSLVNGNASHNDAKRLESLRELAAKDPARARDEAWAWFAEFQPVNEHGHLPWLFSQGTAAKSPQGDCEGMVLCLYGTWFMTFVDRMVRVGRRLNNMGWTGKTFDPETGTGYNRLTPSARLPMLCLIPFYRFRRAGGELIGFDFDHEIEASPLLPGQMVRSITYKNLKYKNPKVLLATRDELVEIIPDVYLGRVLLKAASRWQLVGFFALRQPAKGRR